MKAKLFVSMLSVIAILLIASVISVMEYSRMSSYVTELVAEDVRNINAAGTLQDMCNTYNLNILAVIGDETSSDVPDFDEEHFRSYCDSLKSAFTTSSVSNLADSVQYSFSAYILTSLELENILTTDFADSREWYFERLQPRYNRLCADIEALSAAIHHNLEKNSATFERGYSRSVIPGIVAVGAGILLVLLLLFFILSGYVNPIYAMLDALDAYRASDKKYNLKFEGGDQLQELNDSIREITLENQQLRKRISILRNRK